MKSTITSPMMTATVVISFTKHDVDMRFSPSPLPLLSILSILRFSSMAAIRDINALFVVFVGFVLSASYLILATANNYENRTSPIMVATVMVDFITIFTVSYLYDTMKGDDDVDIVPLAFSSISSKNTNM